MYVESGYVEPGYIGQPSSGAGFILGLETILFDQAPLRPGRTTRGVQATDQSAGGDPFAYTVFAVDKTLTLRWPRLHAYYLRRLREWFKSVQGMAQTFTWRQHDGTELTVRFAEPSIRKVRQIMPDRFEVEVSLWVVS